MDRSVREPHRLPGLRPCTAKLHAPCTPPAPAGAMPLRPAPGHLHGTIRGRGLLTPTDRAPAPAATSLLRSASSCVLGIGYRVSGTAHWVCTLHLLVLGAGSCTCSYRVPGPAPACAGFCALRVLGPASVPACTGSHVLHLHVTGPTPAPACAELHALHPLARVVRPATACTGPTSCNRLYRVPMSRTRSYGSHVLHPLVPGPTSTR